MSARYPRSSEPICPSQPSSFAPLIRSACSTASGDIPYCHQFEFARLRAVRERATSEPTRRELLLRFAS